MIKEINMPMMAPTTDGGSSSNLTWDDIPSAGPADIQSGRNVYIELNEDNTCTKASAGKILQFIKEGFMPVCETYKNIGVTLITSWGSFTFSTSPFSEGITEYHLSFDQPDDLIDLFAYSDALDKPFTTALRQQLADINPVGDGDRPSIH